MKNPTVQSLREAKYKIKVGHYRYIKSDGAAKLILKSKYDGFGNLVLPKGGQTSIHLTTPNGQDYSIIVRAHYKDSYNKKIGVQIGLGRIFKQIAAEENKRAEEPLFQENHD